MYLRYSGPVAQGVARPHCFYYCLTGVDLGGLAGRLHRGSAPRSIFRLARSCPEFEPFDPFIRESATFSEASRSPDRLSPLSSRSRPYCVETAPSATPSVTPTLTGARHYIFFFYFLFFFVEGRYARVRVCVRDEIPSLRRAVSRARGYFGVYYALVTFEGIISVSEPGTMPGIEGNTPWLGLVWEFGGRYFSFFLFSFIVFFSSSFLIVVSAKESVLLTACILIPVHRIILLYPLYRGSAEAVYPVSRHVGGNPRGEPGQRSRARASLRSAEGPWKKRFPWMRLA